MNTAKSIRLLLSNTLFASTILAGSTALADEPTLQPLVDSPFNDVEQVIFEQKGERRPANPDRPPALRPPTDRPSARDQITPPNERGNRPQLMDPRELRRIVEEHARERDEQRHRIERESQEQRRHLEAMQNEVRELEQHRNRLREEVEKMERHLEDQRHHEKELDVRRKEMHEREMREREHAEMREREQAKMMDQRHREMRLQTAKAAIEIARGLPKEVLVDVLSDVAREVENPDIRRMLRLTTLQAAVEADKVDQAVEQLRVLLMED
ncbi:hypothetical protein LOC67_12510 [Stieleria sp. JC731]|uniref:hypothetical protein n=1 Tax=Pirellulaceae TaxID=2691357 RepID=UPI001E4131D4|nr:hypothetical protein [Stieleria sp. JC731]MCC9601369.1 hypothetical protein [Stieleria sp. JC731]